MPQVKGCILFTDVVGSSKLWKEYPKQMHSAIKEHFGIIKRRYLAAK